MSIILSFMQFWMLSLLLVVLFLSMKSRRKITNGTVLSHFCCPIYIYIWVYELDIYRCLNLNLKLRLGSISLALFLLEYVYKRPTLKTYWTILNGEDSILCLFISTLLTLLSTANMYFYGSICIIKSILYAKIEIRQRRKIKIINGRMRGFSLFYFCDILVLPKPKGFSYNS